MYLPVRGDIWYQITDLGTLGGSSSQAYGINNLGQVVGDAKTAGNLTHPFLYSGEVLQDFNSAVGHANGINDLGVVVGYYGSGVANGAIIYPRNDNYNSYLSMTAATAVNSLGHVVGWNTTSAGTVGLLYTANSYKVIGNPISDTRPFAINTFDQVVGVTQGTVYQSAFLYSNDTIKLLEIPNALASEAYGINDAGTIVGRYYNNTGARAFVYNNGITSDIGSLKDLGDSANYDDMAWAINRSGVVVGSARISSGALHAFVYSNNNSLDLNSRVLTPGWTLTQATDVNDSGQIVGTGINSAGKAHAVLLTPTILTQKVMRVPASTLIKTNPVIAGQVITSSSNPFVNVTSDHLMVYANGAFTPGGVVDRSRPTIVLTHGWNDSYATWDSSGGVNLVSQLAGKDDLYNIVAWDWSGDANTGITGVGLAASRTPKQGEALATILTAALGADYHASIHFYGHSLGSLVNAVAVTKFNGTVHNGSNTQVTIFDDAELANTSAIASGNSSIFTSAIPGPGTYSYIDNYVSAFGELHAESSNVILVRGPTKSAPQAFHFYPLTWYSNTVNLTTNSPPAGYEYAIEHLAQYQHIPPKNFTYMQSPDSELDLSLVTSTEAQSVLDSRIREAGLNNSSILVSDIIGKVSYVGDVVIDSVNALGKLVPRFKLTKHSPSYAWVPITVPTGAKHISFDFLFHNLDAADVLTVGIDGTQIFALENSFVVDGTSYNSGLLDVSRWSGQNIELFLGLNSTGGLAGGSMTLNNFQIYTTAAPEPSGLCLLGTGVAVLILCRKIID